MSRQFGFSHRRSSPTASPQSESSTSITPTLPKDIPPPTGGASSPPAKPRQALIRRESALGVKEKNGGKRYDPSRPVLLLSANNNAFINPQDFDIISKGLTLKFGLYQIEKTGLKSTGEEHVVTLAPLGSPAFENARQELKRFVDIFSSGVSPMLVYLGQSTLSLLQMALHLHVVPCPRLFLTGDKWNSYLSRFGSMYALDLMEAFSGYSFPAGETYQHMRHHMVMNSVCGGDDIDAGGLSPLAALLTRHLIVLEDLAFPET